MIRTIPNVASPPDRPEASIYGSSTIYDRLVTLEGGEGSGKSSVYRYLHSELPKDTLFSREPGGSALAERIRSVLLDPDVRMLPLPELLLFLSARADHVFEPLKPALKAGRIAVLDRFAASTDAYQLHAREAYGNFPIAKAAHEAFDIRPGRTYLLDGDPIVLLERIKNRWSGPSQPTGIESRIDDMELAFHERVREGFFLHAEQHPEVVVIDAEQPFEDVARAVLADLTGYLHRLNG
jgi:dTMP kinase